MLTVMTWLWSQPGGRTNYSASHVNIWAAMVRRNLKMPHRLLCVTDMPHGITSDVEIVKPPREFENITLPTWRAGRPQCLRRIVMFAPHAADLFGNRFVNMDLDCVIGGSLDPLFDRPEDIVLFRGTHKRQPYNGSMLMMTAGARPKVYADLTPERAIKAGQEFVGSDQAWMSYVMGFGEKTWDEADGVYRWGPVYLNGNLPTRCRLLFFPGKTKPWSPQRDAFTKLNYRMVMQPAAGKPARGRPVITIK